MSNIVSRVLLEEEYDLLGYAVVKLNEPNGKFKFGDYRMDLHEGPIYVEEADSHPKNGRYIWVSVKPAGTPIRPRTPPPPAKPTADVLLDFEK